VSKLLTFDKKVWLAGHIFSQEQYFFRASEFSEKGIRLPQPTALPLPETQRSLAPEELQAFFDLNYYLKDDLLVKVDRATMRYGLEARCPLLDYRLVEFAFNLPLTLRMKNGYLKYLLHQTLFHFIPESLFERPKRGFSIPLSQWLRGKLKDYVEENLSKNLIESYDLVDIAFVQNLRNQFEDGHHHLYNRIWALAQLHAFIKKYW
jgi:asparagine synthase (glutamine-hydrolysing)